MKKTILVVEDEKLSRRLIAGTLISHGFECLTAEEGEMLERALKLDIEGYFIKSSSIEVLVPKLKDLLGALKNAYPSLKSQKTIHSRI